MKFPTALDVKSERAFFALAALFLGAMVLVNYWPAFLGRVPLPAHLVTQFPAWAEVKPQEPWQPVADIGDLVDYFYPFNAFSTQQIRQGTMPLWNPYVMAGMPFQAEPQTALFYPLHALYYVFSTPTAWSLALILRMLLGAMFMTLMMRSIGATKMGAIISGIAFAFGGFMVAWQGAVMGDAVMWLPLVCYSVHRLHLDQSKRSISLAAFAFAMPILAGHPETAVHVILTGTAGAGLLWVFPSSSAPRFNLRFLLAFFLTGVLAIGLSAVQLLPTLDWARHWGRDLIATWPSFELHQALGFFSRDALRGPNSAGIFVPNAMGYVGMLTLLAAALAPLHRSSRYVIWFLSLVGIGIAGVFGFEPIRWILTHTPIVQGLKNERLILLVDFGLAALAGLGVSMLEEDRPNHATARRVLAWVLVGAAFTVAMICILDLRQATQLRVEMMRRPSFSGALLFAGLIVVVWKLIRIERATLFPFVACALLALDLGTFAYGYTGFSRRDKIFPSAPVFDFLKGQGKPESFRIARLGQPYTLNSGVAYGLQSLTGFEASVAPALGRFVWDFTEGYQDSIYLVGKKVLSTPDRRLDMLNVKYLVAATAEPEYEMFSALPDRFSQVFKGDKVVVFENKHVLPRAFVIGVDGVLVIKGISEQFQVLKEPTFDPLRSVVLDSMPAQPVEASPTASAEFRGSVETLDSHVNGYRFRVQASTPAILVVSQNFYSGWKAHIANSSAAVFPANHALTGIAVPAGTHEVQFEFQPGIFKLGALLSAASVIVLCGLCAFVRRG
jgi:hypothetical protein